MRLTRRVAAFVPSALRAIVDLANANIIPSNYSSAAESLIDAWETQAAPCFEVVIPSETAQSRLDNYIQQANLSQALLIESDRFNASGNVTFYALSLRADGSPVEVRLT
jgi:hypothetical protein